MGKRAGLTVPGLIEPVEAGKEDDEPEKRDGADNAHAVRDGGAGVRGADDVERRVRARGTAQGSHAGGVAGADSDKFEKFGLTPLPGKVVKAPLVKECLANIECRVVEIIRRHDIVVLEAVAAHRDSSRKECRTLQAVGNGTFIVDGRRLDRRRQMRGKIPEGV